MSAAEKFITVSKFGATWCGPCKKVKPILEKLKELYPTATFVEYDQKINEDMFDKFEVEDLPTIIFFINGREFTRVCTASQEKIFEAMEKTLASASSYICGVAAKKTSPPCNDFRLK